jgi:hypothetical protein
MSLAYDLNVFWLPDYGIGRRGESK